MIGSGMTRRIAQRFARARRRFAWLDHVIRAGVRYDRADGGRLAAAVTYYAFFAVFASALLGFAVLGYVLGNAAVLRAVQNYLSANLPRLDIQALRNARGTVGLVAFVVLPVAGLFWIDALRSSIRAIWRLNQYPGKYHFRQLIDLGILTGLALLFAASLAVSDGTQAFLRWLLDVSNADGSAGEWVLAAVGIILGMAVNALLAIAILTVLPRIHMRMRRVYGPALLVAAGLVILNTLGRIYVQRTESNPAYQVVAGAVGLLVFLSLLNQLILFAAALTATSSSGPVRDFAAGPASPQPVPDLRTEAAFPPMRDQPHEPPYEPPHEPPHARRLGRPGGPGRVPNRRGAGRRPPGRLR